VKIKSFIWKTIPLNQKEIPDLVSKPLRTTMYSSRLVNGRTRGKLECVRVSMCIFYVDVYERECVVSECERVNEVDLHISIHISARSTSIYTYGVCEWKGYV